MTERNFTKDSTPLTKEGIEDQLTFDNTGDCPKGSLTTVQTAIDSVLTKIRASNGDNVIAPTIDNVIEGIIKNHTDVYEGLERTLSYIRATRYGGYICGEYMLTLIPIFLGRNDTRDKLDLTNVELDAVTLSNHLYDSLMLLQIGKNFSSLITGGIGRKDFNDMLDFIENQRVFKEEQDRQEEEDTKYQYM